MPHRSPIVAVGLVSAVALALAMLAIHRAPAGRTSSAASRVASQATAEPFVRIDRGLPRRGEWRNGFTVVDFDGDGHLDVVHGPPRRAPGSPPAVFLGDGRGGFEALARGWPALAYDYGDVAVADFDGDGALDLALAAHGKGLIVLARRGERFVPYGPPLGVVGPSWLGSFGSRALAAADWNGDGKADLVALSDGTGVERGKSTPRGGPRVVLLAADAAQILAPTAPVEESGDHLAVADVDGDGRLEIVAAAGALGSKRVLYRASEGGLVAVDVDALPDRASVRAVAVPRGARGVFFAAGLDHASSRPAAFVERLAWTGDRFAGRGVYRMEGASEPRALAADDFDDDGALDLAVGHADGTLRLFRGPELEPAGTLAPEPWRVGCGVYHLEAADVARGGGVEIVVSFAGGPSPSRCPTGGGLSVYRVRVGSARPPVTAGTSPSSSGETF